MRDNTIMIDGDECKVVETLRPGRVIAVYGGAFVFADYVRGTWRTNASTPTVEDRAALNAVIAAQEGFDHTHVIETKPDLPPDDG